MKRLNKLVLTNFRCFAEFEIEFAEPVTYITALNRSGKSTVVDAIQWLITGTCRGTDGAGRGAENLARLGEEIASAVVASEIVTPDGEVHSVARRIGDGPRSKVGKEILEKMGIDPEVGLVCFGWDAFTQMDPGKAKSLLLRTLDAQLKESDLKAILGEDRALLNVKVTDLESIAIAYKQAVEERKAVKRQIEKLQVGVDLGQFPDDMREDSIEDARAYAQACEKKLAELGGQLEAAIAAEARTEGGREASKAELTHQIQVAEEQIRMLKDAIDKIPILGPKELKKKRKELAVMEDKRDEIQNYVRAELQKQVAAITERDLAKKRLESVEALGADSPCPTCTRPLSTSALEKIIAALKDEVAAAQAKHDKIDAGIAAIKEEIPDPAAIRKLQDELGAANGRREEVKNLEVQMGEAGEKLAALQSDLTALEAEQAPTDDQMELKEQGDDPNVLRERIAKGQDILHLTRKYIQVKELEASNQAEKAEVDKKLAALERLVKALAPKGELTTKMLQPKLKPFFDRINAALESFGYEANMWLDEDFGLTVRETNKEEVHWIPYRLLSSSEMLRLGLAVQIAFAQESGCGVICTDDADRLDYFGKEALMDVLDEAIASGAINQAIVAGTYPFESFEHPGMPGWEFINLSE